MALSSSEDLKKIRRLFITGAHSQLFVAKTATTSGQTCYSNIACRDNISESLMDLQNSSLWSSELFPKEAVEKAVEKSSRVLHDEAIRKAVSHEKRAKKSAKNFSSCSHCSSPSFQNTGPQFFRQSSGKGLSSTPSAGSKTPADTV